MSFWEKLPKPFSVLAPMEDVTDTVFRQVIIKAGRPDVFFTEFTNVDAIWHAIRGSQNTVLELPISAKAESGSLRADFVGTPALQRLVFSENERPIVAQIWGKDPEKFYIAAKLIKLLGFDGIDINMGCPAKEVIKAECGAALSEKKHRDRVKEIVGVTQEVGLPVSVKTRLGNKQIEEGWIEFLLEQNLAALTIHARTAKEMSLVPARWDAIKMIVNSKSEARNSNTKIIGNGDIKNLDDPRIAESGVDGVMIGRGIFENPFLFSDKDQMTNDEVKHKRLELLKYHLRLWVETWGNKKHYPVMKKYFKIYVRDWEGAADLRVRLMETESVEMALELL